MVPANFLDLIVAGQQVHFKSHKTAKLFGKSFCLPVACFFSVSRKTTLRRVKHRVRLFSGQQPGVECGAPSTKTSTLMFV